jgi:hypothetical protein
MRIAGDVLDLLCLNPFALLWDGGGSVVGTFHNNTHVVDFIGISHVE